MWRVSRAVLPLRRTCQTEIATPMSDRHNSSKRREKLTPEELWKRVSMQLSSKKLESALRITPQTTNEFAGIAADLAKTTAERIEKYGADDWYRIETENSFLNIPLFKEFETKYVPKTKRKTPAFFPQTALYLLDNPSFYKRFDLDTLFFIFYYCKGTVLQTYAAIRLKEYAWRYHLKYKMWFQRLDEPKLITAEYEKGEFIFFDYETSWNFMKKNDFVFEYYYLEQADHY